MIRARHILHDFDNALESLRADVLMMASLTDRNLQNSMACLLDRDSDLCAVTVADENEIDSLEKKIDSDGVEILVRFQPVASDLRHVVSTMKVAPNLERVADQAVKIARRSRNLMFEPELDEAGALGPMFAEAITCSATVSALMPTRMSHLLGRYAVAIAGSTKSIKTLRLFSRREWRSIRIASPIT